MDQTNEDKRRRAGIGKRGPGIDRRAFVGLLPALFLGPRAFAATEGKKVGRVESAAGAAFARLTRTRPLKPEAEILLGDLVWTDARSRTSLVLDGGTGIHLGEKARLTIDRFVAAEGGTLVLGEGALVFDRAEDLPKIDVTVRTAFGLIGVRGTRFFCGPSRGVFGVFCERGAVVVEAAGIQRRLGPGDGVDIPAAGAPPSAVARWRAPRIAEAFASVLG